MITNSNLAEITQSVIDSSNKSQILETAWQEVQIKLQKVK